MPYWISIQANQVLDAETDISSGKHRLVNLRVKLPVSGETPIGSDPEDWPETGVTPRVRQYAVSEKIGLDSGGPVHFRDAVLNSDLEWVWSVGGDWSPLIARGDEELTEIPLIPFYSSRSRGPYRDLPPFEDTATEQANHMRKMAEYDARYLKDAKNVLYIAGANVGEVHQGANFITGPKGSSATILETTGQAAASLVKALDSIEQAIRRGNLRPLMSEAVARTATEIRVDRLAAASRLEMSVLLDKAAIEQGMRYTSILAGVDGSNGTVHLRHDFEYSLQQTLELANLWVQSGGVVPDEVMWNAARRAGMWLTERDDVGHVVALSRALRETGRKRSGTPRDVQPMDPLARAGGPQPDQTN